MLYNIGIYLIWFAMIIIAPFKKKIRLGVCGRSGLLKKIEQEMSLVTDRDKVWFHCASLGEFEQGRQIIEQWRRDNPQDIIILTFFSPSGYEVRKNYAGADYIWYLPLDSSCNANRFVSAVNPKVAMFVKYEFWSNYTKALQRNGIPFYLVSGIFFPHFFFFSRFGGAYRKILGRFTHLFLQNEESRLLLETIGTTNVTVCGDTRFDRVYEITQQAEKSEVLGAFADKSRVFISGSSWSADDDVAITLIEKFPDIKFILVPHEISESKILSLVARCKNLGRDTIRYTKETDAKVFAKSSVLIVDTVGILSSTYRYCDFAYIGGGFATGIHNVLEAATFGLPLIFGPNYARFSEAVQLVELGAATPIHSAEDAIEWLNRMITDQEDYVITAKKSRAFVIDNIGATGSILNAIGKCN